MIFEIDGNIADTGDRVIAITKTGFDPSDISKRGIDLTNRITLPFTAQNNLIFKSAKYHNTTGNDARKYYAVKVKDNTVLLNGKGFLTGIDKNGYPFQAVDSSKELFDGMSGKIKDMDFESEDIAFNYAAYNTYKLLSSSLWVWPAVCCHERKITENTIFDGNPDGLKYSRPVFRFKTILEKIFDSQGWSISYDADILDRLAINSNSKKFFVTSYQKTLSATVTVAGTQNLTGLDTNDFEYNVTTVSTTINIGTAKTAFRLRGDISLGAEFSILIKATDGAGKIEEQRFYFGENDTEIDIYTDTFESDNATNNVEIILEGTGDFEFDTVYLYTLIEEIDLGDLESNLLQGYMVKAHDNLPDKSQMEIFKEAIYFSNSAIKPDSLEKTINLNTLRYLNKLKSLDWSGKFIQGSETTSTKLGNLAQKNWLKYDNDETLSTFVGADFFLVDSETLPTETDFLVMPYGASIDLEINSYQMAHFNVYGLNEETGATDYIRKNELNDRIIYIYNDPTNTFTIGRFLELDWKNLKTYWSPIFESLYSPELIRCEFNMNKLDFLGFDFLSTVYVEPLKSHFAVASIDDFSPGKETQTRMLKFK